MILQSGIFVSSPTLQGRGAVVSFGFFRVWEFQTRNRINPEPFILYIYIWKLPRWFDLTLNPNDRWNGWPEIFKSNHLRYLNPKVSLSCVFFPQLIFIFLRKKTDFLVFFRSPWSIDFENTSKTSGALTMKIIKKSNFFHSFTELFQMEVKLTKLRLPYP